VADRDDIGFDVKKLKRLFTAKKIGSLSLILFLLVPLVLSVYLRIQPALLPVAEEWAERGLYSNVKANIRNQIDASYPNLPEENKNAYVNDEFQKLIKDGKINLQGQEYEIETVIKENAEFLRDKFQNEAGQTYLLAIDPYYYFRHTRNVVENGNEYGFVDENGRYHDTKIFAGQPQGLGGDKEIRSLHVAIQYYLFRFVRIFNPDADLMSVVFYVPLIIGTLAVIPAFFIARRVSGNIGGFFAATLVALHPAFLTRTAGGFADTDAYNVFFPLLIIWFIFEALDSNTLKKSLVFSGLSGLCVGLFSFAWGGWFFILDFALALIAVVLAYQVIVNRKSVLKGKLTKDIRNTLVSAGGFLVSSVLFVSIFSSFNSIVNLVKTTLQFTQLKEVGTIKVWPNVYTTVAELNPASLKTTLSQISLGSKLWLFIAFIGLIIPLVRFNKDKLMKYFISGSVAWFLFLIIIQNSIKNHLTFAVLLSVPVVAWVLWSLYKQETVDLQYSIILVIWFAATIYASSKGVRFILLLVPAFAIAAGIAVGVITKVLSEWLSKELSVNKILSNVVIFALFIALLLFPTNFVRSSLVTAENEIPSMNDDWYNTLTKIRDESEPDAIINSWWDFGHWFAAIGDRAVTLDGGRQNSPQAHWLGKLMLTWDETESIGILRYLDCGSNTGYDQLLEYKNGDELTTINILYDIIVEERQEAMNILKSNGLSDDQANDVLERTHCDPPENYFITSEDMVGKSGVWAHFGSWNFTRAVMYNNVHDLGETQGISILKDDYGFEDSEARRLYTEIRNANPDRWISPWPGYAGSAACQISEGIATCQNGIVFDYNTEEATVSTPEGVKHPKAISFIDINGDFKTRTYSEDVLIFPQTGRPLGAALVPEGGRTTSYLMDFELTSSIFTRLFLYENKDGSLTHFDRFHKVTDVTGQKIIVWKIDWDGKTVAEMAPAPEILIDETPEIIEEVIETVDDSKKLVKIERILIKTDTRSDEEAKSLVDQVYDELTSDNFLEQQARNSECTEDCDMPWFGMGVMEDSYDLVFDMEKGDISEPVRTTQGYEIIYLVDTK